MTLWRSLIFFAVFTFLLCCCFFSSGMINCVVFAVPCFWRFQMQRALLGLLCGLFFVVASGCASHSTQDHANNKNKNDSGSSNVEVYGVIDAGIGHTRVR